MEIKIALAGNPNSGKTTMFNHLTGSSQYVGNWPGVTVEKKEGKLKGHKNVKIVDLPGIYSLSPYTLEEVVSREFLINEKPDAIINIVDSTNIERNLYLTTQLMELGIPVIIALNMTDIVRKNGDKINVQKLADELGCGVVETSALKGEGCIEAAEKAISLAEKKYKAAIKHSFSKEIEQVLSQIENKISSTVDSVQLRWFAIKLFERDEKVIKQLKLSKEVLDEIEEIVTKCEDEFDDDGESIITNERYTYISSIIKDTVKRRNTSNVTTSDKIDRIVTNRILALPIFAVIMWLVYFVSISTVGGWATDWVNDVLFGEIIPPAVEGALEGLGTADWLNSLILNGIIGGVSSVLGFLPQMVVLFIFLAILEDCGYMARVAFIMDRIFKKFGLSGKSFIPMLIGTGCSVPGIMASRTIENERDRRMTIITTSFIPCGAKLPIIALIAGALFNDSIWVAPAAYFIGVIAVVVSGIMLKKTQGFAGEPAPFVMELPAYHVPGIKGLAVHTWDRVKSFIIKAGTVIFLACGLIWFLSTFNFSLQMVDADESILSKLGRVIAPIFTPLGWGNWESAVSTLTGLIAKENVVGTFGVLFGHEEVAENGKEIWAVLAQSFTQLSAFSFLLFNLLCAPCFAAIGAIRREMGSIKLTLFAVGYQTTFAYSISLMVYQFGRLFTGNGNIIGVLVAAVLLVFMLYMLLKPPKNLNNPKSHIKKDAKEKVTV